jgi:hypothetical protein
MWGSGTTERWLRRGPGQLQLEVEVESNWSWDLHVAGRSWQLSGTWVGRGG